MFHRVSVIRTHGSRCTESNECPAHQICALALFLPLIVWPVFSAAGWIIESAGAPIAGSVSFAMRFLHLARDYVLLFLHVWRFGEDFYYVVNLIMCHVTDLRRFYFLEGCDDGIIISAYKSDHSHDCKIIVKTRRKIKVDFFSWKFNRLWMDMEEKLF